MTLLQFLSLLIMPVGGLVIAAYLSRRSPISK
jgi:hypothetical protein